MRKRTNKIIQARLDDETNSLLQELSLALDLNNSEIIRQSLKIMASCTPKIRRKRLVGVGKFSSGQKDLGSNKTHLEGFGK